MTDSGPMRLITTRPRRIYCSVRILGCRVPSMSPAEPSHSSADFTINTSEFDFRQARPWRDLSNCCQMPSSTALASRELTVSKPSVNEP